MKLNLSTDSVELSDGSFSHVVNLNAYKTFSVLDMNNCQVNVIGQFNSIIDTIRSAVVAERPELLKQVLRYIQNIEVVAETDTSSYDEGDIMADCDKKLILIDVNDYVFEQLEEITGALPPSTLLTKTEYTSTYDNNTMVLAVINVNSLCIRLNKLKTTSKPSPKSSSKV